MQARYGNVDTDRSEATDKLNWDSWNSNKDKSRSACIDEFVKLGEEFAKKKGVTRKQIVEDIEAGYE